MKYMKKGNRLYSTVHRKVKELKEFFLNFLLKVLVLKMKNYVSLLSLNKIPIVAT